MSSWVRCLLHRARDTHALSWHAQWEGAGERVYILMTTGSVDCSATRDAQPAVANFRRKSPFAVAREKKRYSC